jgi:hypothetical protein
LVVRRAVMEEEILINEQIALVDIAHRHIAYKSLDIRERCRPFLIRGQGTN